MGFTGLGHDILAARKDVVARQRMQVGLKDKVALVTRAAVMKKGDFVYLLPWSVHGIENTGIVPLMVLISTSPPKP